MTRIAKIILAALLSCGCHHSKTLPESLTAIFTDRLHRIDTATALDSLHVQFNIPVTEKLGRIIEDSVYIREYSRIRAQLAGALLMGNKDSIEFYKYEIRYMEQEIDSLGRGIALGDSSRRYGSLVSCAYFLGENHHSLMDSTLIFIDTTNTVRYTEYIDSALQRTVRAMR